MKTFHEPKGLHVLEVPEVGAETCCQQNALKDKCIKK